MFNIGDTVEIYRLSKETVETALRYKKSSPLMVCPCDLKNKAVTVKEIIKEENLAILEFGDSLTLAYFKDLRKLEV